MLRYRAVPRSLTFGIEKPEFGCFIMPNAITRFLASSGMVVLAGATVGLLAPLMQWLGNPPNMGICVACFERDIAGALGLHRAGVVQYIRPEIIGFVLGSFLAALVFREFKARTGSAPLVRFVLGAFAMIGALTFLGCPWRALLRLAGGDLNALTGLAGLIAGIFIGVGFIRSGYNLGRARPTYPSVGWIIPLLAIALLFLALTKPQFSDGGPIFTSTKGPGSLFAPWWISLSAAMLVGFLIQRSRFCTTGAIRNVIIMRDSHLMSGLIVLVLTATVTNLALGQFNPGVAGQPVAHSSHLWNLLGMVLAGLAYTLAGGCPGRQLILSGEGDGDAAVFVLGMFAGAAFAHNFSLAAVPDRTVDEVLQVGGVASSGMAAVLLGLIVCLAVGFTMRERMEPES